MGPSPARARRDGQGLRRSSRVAAAGVRSAARPRQLWQPRGGCADEGQPAVGRTGLARAGARPVPAPCSAPAARRATRPTAARHAAVPCNRLHVRVSGADIFAGATFRLAPLAPALPSTSSRGTMFATAWCRSVKSGVVRALLAATTDRWPERCKVPNEVSHRPAISGGVWSTTIPQMGAPENLARAGDDCSQGVMTSC